MNIIIPAFEFIDCNSVLRNIERGARTCYKSEDKICPGSDIAIIEKILTPKHGIKHESVLEHGVITAGFITDRGVTHEMVRHRIAAFSQESTRYCNYSKAKFGNEITVIAPFFFAPFEEQQDVVLPEINVTEEGTFILKPGSAAFTANAFDIWALSCLWSQWSYNVLTQQFKRSAQEARSVLPNSLKTEIQVTANVREWRHILTLRTGRDAHPQIRQIMVPLAHVLAQKWPVLFGEFAEVEHTHPAMQIVVQPEETGGYDGN